MLKNEFKEFFEKIEIDMNNLEEDTIIVLDTNVLLHIYRFSKDYKGLLLESLKKIKNNIYVPYIVGLEFNLNKQEVKKQMHTKRESFNDKILKEKENFVKQFNQTINNIGIKSGDEKEVREQLIKSFSQKISLFIDTFLKEDMESEFELIDISNDSSEELAEILNGRVGACPSQDIINEIQEDGKKRFKNEQPPGFEDESIKGNKIRVYGEIEYFEKFGDLLIWKDILSKVSDSNNSTSIKNVVFVTDDKKKDWQYILHGEKIGPRAELKKEMNLIGANLVMMDTQLLIKQTTGTKIEIIEDDIIKRRTKKYLLDKSGRENYNSLVELGRANYDVLLETDIFSETVKKLKMRKEQDLNNIELKDNDELLKKLSKSYFDNYDLRNDEDRDIFKNLMKYLIDNPSS